MKDLKNSFSLRNANKEDKDLFFEWVNDPEVRRWSFSPQIIKSEEHSNWFNSKMDDKNVLIFIFQIDSCPAGFVRFEKDISLVLNYLISSDERGKGRAVNMLKMAIMKIPRKWEEIDILAYTLPNNIASIKSLEKAGFYLKSKTEEKHKYIYKR